MTDTPDLEARVAALEELVRFPPQYAYSAPHLTEEQAARFRKEFEHLAGLGGPFTHRVIHQPPPLSPDEFRQLLRECVTVVKPRETLIVHVPLTWTPTQVSDYSDNIRAAAEILELPFRAVVVPAESLGIAEPAEDATDAA